MKLNTFDNGNTVEVIIVSAKYTIFCRAHLALLVKPGLCSAYLKGVNQILIFF